ncbi:hypothetical protein DEA8626_00823 [Defluviimonas aquaemixtae]|uniref:Methyltransferase type 11 domain-containing protein n=1 Tax=Albidovulum aquaemixtae TaxID=1542388 RepID=A0A2R8B3W3_9RHOB|nr:class I SAM-dependent methyltransferase [Defluviimonas aquaemixtae]SPH17306.1 hypothetical protein DEA8626_00823 [Defluviimonas aquaemixtae]
MAEKEKKRRVDFKAAAEAAERTADAQRIEGDGIAQHVYSDFETYRRVQEEGNKAKLGAQFVKKEHIFFLADWLKTLGHEVDFGLCHGVRRGKEQAWFRRRLPGAEVIGTDISETAQDFANTVQWDFHEANPEWRGRADFVYSNSWDHAYDPVMAFRAWADSLKSGGVILLDHTRDHLPKKSNALDPFGATEAALMGLLNERCGDLGRTIDVLDRSEAETYRARVIVFERA